MTFPHGRFPVLPRRRGLRTALPAVCAVAVSAAVSPPLAHATTQTFGPAGGEQVFTVPPDVTSLHVVAVGARGGAGADGGGAGGFGAVATSDVSVMPGQVFYVEVAGNGSDGCCHKGMGPGPGGAGGFNGGGVGGTGGPGGGGGGGESDIRTLPQANAGSLGSRVVVAAGGGGGGAPGSSGGGAGGAAGAPGGNGGSDTTIAQPGTPTAGGAGGTNTGFSSLSGTNGSLGSGGAGGHVGPGGGGGGGGGGVYGGGGGAAGESSTGGGGGAGGSSGFGSGVVNGAIAADSTGAPSVTLTYTAVSSGGGGGPSIPPAVVTVGRETISPTAFLAAPGGPSALASRVRYGAKVTFTLNQAATVRFTVVQPRPGRRGRGGRCVAPTRANRTARRCTRLVTLPGSFSRTGHAGANSFRFTGRLAGRTLAPGSYRLIATPRLNGRAGLSKSASFRILRPPRVRR
jgi:hypothetical protein